MDVEFLREIDRDEMRCRVAALTGYEQERQEIKALARIKFDTAELNSSYLKFLNLNGNVLLYGKPGTGKTSICYDCMLSCSDATYYQLKLPEIISEKLGETSKNLSKAFNYILQESVEYPTFLLIEEIEAFFPDRQTSRDLPDMKRALTVMMEYLDCYNPNLMILCTTNFKKNLDPAIIRRFGYQAEIKNGSEEDIIRFLTHKENPFSEYFSDRQENAEIARAAFEQCLSFSVIKDKMKNLYLANHGDSAQVNGKTLLKLVKGETK